MKLKALLKEFALAEDLAGSDLDDICCDSPEASEALREIVEPAFKLGVAEGLSSAERVIARSLKLSANEMDDSGNPALQAVMQMSARCYRAASEPSGKGNTLRGRSTKIRDPRMPDPRSASGA